MGKFRDITGQKFGRMLAVRDSGRRTSSNKVLWECLCDCGNVTFVVSANLVNGNTKSCGCLSKERLMKMVYKDGRSYDPNYSRRLHLSKKYGMTLEEFLELYDK